MKKIQVGFLMSYDYELLKKAIPPVYAAADSVFIALDENYRTWSGGKILVDPEFFKWLEEIDVDQKITIYKDNFYVPELTAMENEVRERKMLAQKMGKGNWLIQVDCDEYFLNFEEFVNDLRKYDKFLDNPEDKPVQIAAFLLVLYKYVDNGILYVEKVRRQMMATNFPDYKVGRNTKQRIIYTQNLLLHESVSRSEEEIITKFRNWGHREETNPDQFLEKWRAVNSKNFSEYQDFFYLEPEKWKKLAFVKGNSVEQISSNLDYKTLIPSDFYIYKKNFGQWFKSHFK
ncbi:hypothetical protein RM545_14185 [Zunongwangia sp. F260]|uniref:Glycosyltransferase n=1 Tax=Autumnicola lenta TaxID=3075593 RepID=A0ABU3CPH8_9FLAO|nr:hypothetical protein [Zunongwangia sp. F260]MDT0647845.1 hypothetical protein [Zunongwangia sp. F260]